MWPLVVAFLAKNTISAIIGLIGGIGAIVWYFVQKARPNPFNIIKLISGFNIFTGAVTGRLIYYGIVLIVAFGIYHKTFIAPTISNKTQIKGVQNYYAEGKPEKFVGFQAGHFRFGFSIK